MTSKKQYMVSRVLIGLMALAMAAVTLPAYTNPTLNPGLASLSGPALSLGETAGAFLGRQLTLILIALIGAVVGYRYLVILGALSSHSAYLTFSSDR